MPIPFRILEANGLHPRSVFSEMTIACYVHVPDDMESGVQWVFCYSTVGIHLELGSMVTEPLTEGFHLIDLVINPPNMELLPEASRMQSGVLIIDGRYQGAVFVMLPVHVIYEYDHFMLRRFSTVGGLLPHRVHRYLHVMSAFIEYQE